MAENSNIEEITAFLDAFVDSFNFTRVGTDQSLGRDLAMRVVEGMQERAHSGPPGGWVGGQWDENADDYAAWKEKRYAVAQSPNVRTGQMLDQLNLYGRTEIEPKLITMKYGLDKRPDRTNTGVELSKADKMVTDVQKAYFAHTGQSRKKVLRPFYEVNAADGEAVSKIAQENLNDMIRETNAASGY